MKIKVSSILQALLLSCLLTIIFTQCGCVSVPATDPWGNPTTKKVPDVERIAAFSKEAVALGVSEALVSNPQWSPYFSTCLKQLTALEASDKITVQALLNVLAQLPIKELQGREARLAFSGARLIIASQGWSDVGSEQMTQVRPIVVAIREGLELAGVQ